MKRFPVIALLALTLGLGALAGVALAGNENGNGNGGGGNSGSPPGNSANAPGQQQQQAAQQQPAQQQPAQQQQSAPATRAKSSAPGQVKKSSSSTSHAASPQHTSTPHSSTPHTTSHGVNATTAGMKPGPTTKKNVHTTAGASPDVSKRYGNGKTAAQIAKSRGAPDNTDIYGPGNSQPHKVCGKNGHYVDVHAVKSYSATTCAPHQVQQTQQTQVQSSACPPTTVQTTDVLGMWHLNGKGQPVHLMTNTHSAHFTKHADIPATVTVTKVVSAGSCAQTSNTSNVSNTSNAAAANTSNTSNTSNTANASNAAGAQPAAGGVLGANASSPAAGTGGVLGAQVRVAQPASHTSHAARHGVLGAVARVGTGNLPFTGLPVWIAVLVAAALIAAGVLVRRRFGDASNV
jgi:hypothetical protein